MNDQCVINTIYENEWQALPPDLNMQGCAKYTQHWDGAAIRHFQGHRKFFPPKAWRNDKHDIAIINSVCREIGLPTHPHLSLPGVSLAYRANKLRLRRRLVLVDGLMNALPIAAA